MTDSDTPEPTDLGPVDEIRPGAWFAPGRQLVVSDQLVQGLRFSHHVSQAELAAGWIEVVPDFAAIAAFAHRATLASGDPVDVVELPADQLAPHQLNGLVLRGPDGWLAGGNAGDIATLVLEGGQLRLEWGPPLVELQLDSRPIVETYEQLGGGQPVPLVDLVLHLLIDARPLFEAERPAPMRDLLLGSGLDVEGTTVVRASVRSSARSADPVGLPGLGISSALAAERLLGGALASEVTPEVLEALADADAAAAVAEQIVGGSLVTLDQLTKFVELLEGAGSPHAATVGFLRSRLAEWQGDAAGQETAVAPAVAAGQLAALSDASWFAADRGDAREAVALLRSAGVPADDPDMQLLARYTATGPRWVGRNDPCWCGSGRKHKQCHLSLNGHDLSSRLGWLHAKGVMFLQRPPQRAQLLSVATASAGLSSPDDSPARVIAAACDATVSELCLFEGGVFERFVAQRGDLLPEDEQEHARAWAGERHRVWSVVDGVLHDAATGDERPLDADSIGKVPASGLVLAVAQPGPLVLPGPVTLVTDALGDEVRAVLAGGDVLAVAALVGRELGWTSAPAEGPAPDALAPAP